MPYSGSDRGCARLGILYCYCVSKVSIKGIRTSEGSMITLANANSSMFYHVALRNADGSALRARANGRVKLWKTRPLEFRIPVKYGLKQCFYIDNNNAHQWLTYDPTEEAAPQHKGKEGLYNARSSQR